MLLNEPAIRDGVIKAAADRYGYPLSKVFLRLYVGKFAGSKGGHHEAAIRAWGSSQQVGGGPIEIYGLSEIVAAVQAAATSKTYRDNPVLVTLKVLSAAGLIRSSIELSS